MIKRIKRGAYKRKDQREEVIPPPTVLLTEFVLHAGTDLSDPVNLLGGTLIGFITPASWHPAGATLQLSFDGSTWFDVYDNEGKPQGLSTSAMPINAFINVQSVRTPQGGYWLRVRSGTHNNPIVQPADCTFSAVTTP